MSQAFISYSHADFAILERMHVHMATLIRENKIKAWYDREILAGANLERAILDALNASKLFIAIVSPDYLHSNYCYDKEFQMAQQLQAAGELIIVPVIAQPCDWMNSPFGQMKAIPKDGKPISEWTNDNAAYLNVINEIRRLLDTPQVSVAKQSHSNTTGTAPVKTYKVKRDFTQVDLVNFKNDSFRLIKKYFLDSLEEINGDDQIQALLTNEEKDAFTCLISNRAKVNSNGYITIYMPTESLFGRSDLSYTLTERQRNSIQLDNIFTIENDQYQLYWTARNLYNSGEKKAWTVKEIAEKLWKEFIEQVGISY